MHMQRHTCSRVCTHAYHELQLVAAARGASHSKHGAAPAQHLPGSSREAMRRPIAAGFSQGQLASSNTRGPLPSGIATWQPSAPPAESESSPAASIQLHEAAATMIMLISKCYNDNCVSFCPALPSTNHKNFRSRPAHKNRAI